MRGRRFEDFIDMIDVPLRFFCGFLFFLGLCCVVFYLIFDFIFLIWVALGFYIVIFFIASLMFVSYSIIIYRSWKELWNIRRGRL